MTRKLQPPSAALKDCGADIAEYKDADVRHLLPDKGASRPEENSARSLTVRLSDEFGRGGSLPSVRIAE